MLQRVVTLLNSSAALSSLPIPRKFLIEFWAARTFKFSGWKCSLHGWKYFAAINAACISRNISWIGLRSFFFPCLETLHGISQSEASWHFNGGALLVSRTKRNLPSSTLPSYHGSRTCLCGLPQQEESSRELQLLSFVKWAMK